MGKIESGGSTCVRSFLDAGTLSQLTMWIELPTNGHSLVRILDRRERSITHLSALRDGVPIWSTFPAAVKMGRRTRAIVALENSIDIVVWIVRRLGRERG